MKARIKYRNRVFRGLIIIFLLFVFWAGTNVLPKILKGFIEDRISLALGTQVSIERLKLKPVFPLVTLVLQGIRVNYKKNLQVYLDELEIACNPKQFNKALVSGAFTKARIHSSSKIPDLTDLSGQIEMTKQGLSLYSVKAKLLDLPLELEAYITNPLERPRLDLRVRLQRNEELRAGLKLKGDLNTFSITGYMKKIPKGKILLEGSYNREQIKANVQIEHFQIYNSDLVCHFNLEAILEGQEKYKILKGKLHSDYTVLNHNPFSEFESLFAVDLPRRKLFIEKLVIGGNYYMQGAIGLLPDYLMDIDLDIRNAPMEHITMLSPQKPGWNLGDRYSGSLRITGPALKPFCKGRLTAGKGRIRDMPYDSIEVNLAGEYPRLHLDDSKIYKEEGRIGIVGALNFQAKNLFQDVRLVVSGNMAVLGWDIKRRPYSDLIEMDRDLGEELKIGFRAYLEDETLYEQQSENEMELELKVDESQSLKMRIRDDEELLGYEHSIKF
ncbi:MAG: hypothetical protein KAV18_05245 [Candidatus Omnitrophica bacterium]|nr:hypothetical protein [Candidatus Omnitrophota bacterium]